MLFNPYNLISNNNRNNNRNMSSFTLIDELGDFTNELIYLIKQDWEKFKLFIKEYKKYVFWVVVLLITMQFTDLMSLGSSWDKYCSKTGIQNGIQTGGGGESYAPVSEKGRLQKIYAEEKSKKKQLKADKKSTAKDKSTEGIKKHIAATEAKQKSKEARKSARQGLGKDAGANGKTKAYKLQGETKEQTATRKADQSINSKQLAMQKKAMALSGSSGSETSKIDKSVKWFKSLKPGAVGSSPVFGNLDRIFAYTSAMFSIIIGFFVILGILSLPVLIFLIITYCVIKMLVGHFVIL